MVSIQSKSVSISIKASKFRTEMLRASWNFSDNFWRVHASCNIKFHGFCTGPHSHASNALTAFWSSSQYPAPGSPSPDLYFLLTCWQPGWSAISFIINFHFSNFSATAHNTRNGRADGGGKPKRIENKCLENETGELGLRFMTAVRTNELCCVVLCCVPCPAAGSVSDDGPLSPLNL